MKNFVVVMVVLLASLAFAKKPIAPPFNVSVNAVYAGGTVVGTFTFVFNGTARPSMTDWDFTVGSDIHLFNHGFGNENSFCGTGGSNSFFLGPQNQYVLYTICGNNSEPDAMGSLYLIFDRTFLDGAQQLSIITPTAVFTKAGFPPKTYGSGLYVVSDAAPARQITAGTVVNTNLPAAMSCRVGQ